MSWGQVDRAVHHRAEGFHGWDQGFQAGLWPPGLQATSFKPAASRPRASGWAASLDVVHSGPHQTHSVERRSQLLSVLPLPPADLSCYLDTEKSQTAACPSLSLGYFRKDLRLGSPPPALRVLCLLVPLKEQVLGCWNGFGWQTVGRGGPYRVPSSPPPASAAVDSAGALEVQLPGGSLAHRTLSWTVGGCLFLQRSLSRAG
ncbi:uncharacterized protein [Symphalangus syndactylus]|uniref:uncharacterized protein n=1 Tax=Symphalangus syndactylus TaxID=9590 RepID=UPI00244298E3|nr:uncharacterized protein LOC129464660 [Symphalangus syndactylus]